MKPVKFEEAETELLCNGIPNCQDLFIGTALDFQTDTTYKIAKFELSPEELERVNADKSIWLCNRGIWVPVLPTVWHPYKELKYSPVRPKQN